jgi:hypothetical protein
VTFVNLRTVVEEVSFTKVHFIYGSLLISIGRNPSQRDELLRYAFIGFSLVEVSGLIGLVMSLLLLFGFDRQWPYTITLRLLSLNIYTTESTNNEILNKVHRVNHRFVTFTAIILTDIE